MNRNNIRIAIQSKGRLKEDSLKLLHQMGIEFDEISSRSLLALSKDKSVEIMFVRHSDIPQYVQAGVADFGIVGKNVLRETAFTIHEISSLEFGYCKLVIAIPENSNIYSINDLESERIATSYTQSLRTYLNEKNINASIIEISGSVEVAPLLGLADAICDLTQTGSTLKENKLKILDEVFHSSATLIQSKITSKKQDEFIKKFHTIYQPAS